MSFVFITRCPFCLPLSPQSQPRPLQGWRQGSTCAHGYPASGFTSQGSGPPAFSLRFRVRPTPISASGSNARCHGGCTPAFAPALTFGPGVSMMLVYKPTSVCCRPRFCILEHSCVQGMGVPCCTKSPKVGRPGIPNRGTVRSEKSHSPLVLGVRMVWAGTTGR